MEIILKKDITGVGYKNDLLKVKDGFARNYLIPKGMAVIATTSEKKQLAELKKQQSFKEEKIRKEAEAIKTALDGAVINIPAKVGESGKIFGSVTTVQIAQAIQALNNIEVERKHITIDEAIKTVGTYTAKIKLLKDFSFDIQFNVVGE